MLIPNKITMTRWSSEGWFTESDSTIYIQKGELISGVMIKAIVGDGAGGLVHNIWLDITPEETCLFMTRA